MSDSVIRFDQVSFSYGSKEVVKNISFSVPAGKTFGLVGESGSGKTTTLCLANGLLTPTAGKVFIDNQEFDFTKGERWRRRMGYSIQGSGLFPHLSVEKNITLIARKENWTTPKVAERLAEVCSLVNLPADRSFLSKRPREISGGQQQRVGIARALFMAPKILLMDEPFGALDPLTREEVQNEFMSLQEKLNLTTLLVTHDLAEAFRMCDQIILLHGGEVIQVAKPADFIRRPASDYVTKFVQSHSPGRRLKSIKLYSVVSDQVMVTVQRQTSYDIWDLRKPQPKSVATFAEVIAAHQLHQQEFIYWLNQDGVLLNFQKLGAGTPGESRQDWLRSRDDIIKGIRSLMTTDLPLVPVVDSAGKMIGVFSEGAMDAL